MRTFEVMVKGILMYGVEQWGWKKRKQIEEVQIKYVRWMLNLNRNTPWHTIREETKVEKIAIFNL